MMMTSKDSATGVSVLGWGNVRVCGGRRHYRTGSRKSADATQM
jgi:hypothetical protein